MEENERDRKTVLVVDDEEDVRDIIRLHLEKAGYHVLTSKDGEDAIKTLEEDDVSVVITDIKMPKLNGFGVLDFARNHYSYVPVVMLTGYIDVNQAVDAMKRGSFHYLTKPIRKKELIHTVEEAIKSAEAERKMMSFEISQIYLLAEGGLAIYHEDRGSSNRYDSDIFGSMLTAVRMFIEDSFDRGKEKEKSFEYGNSRILIEEGNGFFLVVIGTGKNTEGIRNRMRKAVKRIERKYGKVIAAWNGDLDAFSNVETDLTDLLDLGGEEKMESDKIQQPSKMKNSKESGESHEDR